MPIINIFENDAFSALSLSTAINIVPFAPKRLGAMGLFESQFPEVNMVGVERKGNLISLIPTKPRGSGETTKRPAGRRDMIPFYIPYVPYDDAVLASDVAGQRAWDSDSALETVAAKTNEKITGLRADHEQTHEYFRIGAVKGIILDSDGTTVLINLFTAFGITQYEVVFDLAGTGEQIKQDCIDIIRYIEDVLGGTGYDHIHALCGNTFYDQLISNDEVKDAYSVQTDAKWRIVTQGQGTPGRGTSQVSFGDIVFENYRGKVGNVNFIAPTKAHFFPVGVQGLFQQHFGPAETIEDVNKPGQEVFAMQEPMKFGAGMELHSESNPLMICRRPALLVLGHSEAGT